MSFATLPAETLLGIFSHLEDSRAALCAASVVCRAWRKPSQATLHQSLALSTDGDLATWLEHNKGPEAEYWTRSLVLKARAGKANEVRGVVGRVRGLRSLELNVDRARFAVNLLEQHNLERLTSLTLATSFVAPTTQQPLALPFNLTSLSLSGMYISYPPALISALAEASPRLRSLSLSCYGSAPPTFFASLAATFPSLTTLHLHGSPPPAVIALLPLCTQLETFTCWDPTPALLRALPESVSTIEFTKDYIRPSGTELSYLELFREAKLLERKGLKVLRWRKISEATLKNQRGGKELLEECEKRGVRAEFGVQAIGKFGIPGASFAKRWVPGFPVAQATQ